MARTASPQNPPPPRRSGAADARGRAGARVLRVALAVALFVLPSVAGVPPAQAQGLVVSRNQFATQAERPEHELPASGAPITVVAGRWRVTGAARLRVVSPNPEVAAVLRYRPAEPGEAAGPLGEPPSGQTSAPAALRLYVIVIAETGVPRYQYQADGALLGPQGYEPQRRFRVGERGLESALAGPPGRVTQLVIQDDADVELRLRRDSDTLELQVVPPADGGVPSGSGPPHYLGRPLAFADYTLLASGYKENALGELWLGHRLAGRLNAVFPSGSSALALRVLVTAQAWRSDRLALWAEGGGGFLRVTDSAAGTSSSELHVAGGLRLDWRYEAWGASLQAGFVGSDTVLSLLGGWQAWRHVGLVLSWQSLQSRSGVGLGAAVGF
ncbi:MAG TPA: hypothetical protein VKB51_02495 [bacterium]|nr:hypothetical protein [bacterium]